MQSMLCARTTALSVAIVASEIFFSAFVVFHYLFYCLVILPNFPLDTSKNHFALAFLPT